MHALKGAQEKAERYPSYIAVRDSPIAQHVKKAIADKLINLVKAGERDPDVVVAVPRPHPARL
jgi:hypothetical protein